VASKHFVQPDGSKVCAGCGKLKPAVSYYHKVYKSGWVGVQSRCKDCRPRKQLAVNQLSYRQRARTEALSHYSNGDIKCACCAERESVFLALDHVNNDGYELRKLDKTHSQLAVWLRKNGWPGGYQVLCHNCNMAKSINGVCPHELIRTSQAA
jgi:hypothetical protein